MKHGLDTQRDRHRESAQGPALQRMAVNSKGGSLSRWLVGQAGRTEPDRVEPREKGENRMTFTFLRCDLGDRGAANQDVECCQGAFE